ncbi:unnamed protein product [Taenia asiatica]|uniref:Uncharacterized protein n=1 Tax=Taenia asiatica TaxID=60517 RepID=A0A0R3W0L1_TAEAS|nr:unnamed protein product [Taenia asiatica]
MLCCRHNETTAGDGSGVGGEGGSQEPHFAHHSSVPDDSLSNSCRCRDKVRRSKMLLLSRLDKSTAITIVIPIESFFVELGHMHLTVGSCTSDWSRSVKLN